MAETSKIKFADMPTTYEGLIELHQLRPIRDDAACERATEIGDAMAVHTLNKDQEDYFEVLCCLLHEYEAHHLEYFNTSPEKAAEYLDEQQQGNH